MTTKDLTSIVEQAADLILQCDAILFTSGAGMGVGSGLGTFRGIGAGVWPPLLQHPDLDFTDMSNPTWFHKPQGNSDQHDTANFGYAFWTYRYESYTSAEPHQGYQIAHQWSKLPNVKSSFSFTSNIDGHWIKSGWSTNNVYECHGAIDFLQCVKNCSDRIWPTNGALKLKIDPVTNCVIDPLPKCPDCQELARPNVLMFGDWGYIGHRQEEQYKNYEQFRKDLENSQQKLLIIELGAGTAVPTVRYESERSFNNRRWKADFIRINPSDDHVEISRSVRSQGKGQCLELPLDASTALIQIDEILQKKKINVMKSDKSVD